MAESVIADIASAIHVRHILTPMNAVCRFTRLDRVEILRAHLNSHMFDFSPIFPVAAQQHGEGTADPPSPDGVMRRSDLRKVHPDEVIERFVQPLASDVLIDAKASLTELIDRFAPSSHS